ncbi:MAG: EI24 domain-containing protein [Cetobacterium sp.]|uniref:EI24 domain-containing protein n=1 Tax=unclassified Cetobacterium TaxID=2630983 RepID=UPI00163CBDDD|nr:EI24 domain-containing protein [Cetobacterium sp. 2A]MBC2856785.1 EI24 domain-containing protein [Cetobacterium sp. 2A]
MIKSIRYIIQSYIEAFSIIEKGNLKKFYFLPGLISIALFILLYYFSSYISFSLFNQIERIVNIKQYSNLALLVLKLLVLVIGFLVYFLIYKSLLLIILSPFLSYISERTESTLTGVSFKFSLKENIKFVFRGILLSSRYFAIEILGTIFILLLGFIPVVNLFAPLLLLLLQGYFSGASFADYTLERKGMSHKDSSNFSKKHFTFSLINGIIFLFLFLIPIIGIFIAPLLTCVATTIGTLKLLDNK